MTLGTERNKRAQRRAASQERAASAARETAKEKRQPGAPTAVDTGGGAVVTLETDEIRPNTGRTPMNLSLGGFPFDGEGRSASVVSGTGGSPGAGWRGTGGGSRKAGRGGDDAPRDGEDGVVANADENQDVDVDVTVDLTGAGNDGGRDGGGPGLSPGERDYPRQVIVREKFKALKIAEFN
ncbi:hypothetical protein PInf_018711 [Phytophthora infestans]|nr:hypothetical protein PInf_018711 [Phytophthora infestans]